jgi:hypothetical protein
MGGGSPASISVGNDGTRESRDIGSRAEDSMHAFAHPQAHSRTKYLMHTHTHKELLTRTHKPAAPPAAPG